MDPWKKQRERLLEGTGLLAGRRRRAAIRDLAAGAAAGDVTAARVLAGAYTHVEDPSVRELLRDGLRGIDRPAPIDAVCAVWEGTRDSGLAEVLRERGWVAGRPMDRHVLTALLAERPGAIRGDPKEVSAALLQACGDADPVLAERAAEQVRAVEDPARRDALCEALIAGGCEAGRAALLEAGYLPRDPGRRGLFLFLTDQHERYEALDFDGRLLRAAYDTAPDPVSREVATRIRRSGRADWTAVLQGGSERKRLTAMAEPEWETVLTVLLQARRLDDLWTLLFEAPPHRSAQIVRALRQCGYRPAREDDQVAFERLTALCPPRGQERILYHTDEPPVEARTLDGSVGSYLHVGYSDSGRLLGVSERDVRLWDTSSGRILLQHPGLGRFIFASENAKAVATVRKGGVELCDVATGQCRPLNPNVRGATTLAFSPDGKLLVVAPEAERAGIWSARTGSWVAWLEELPGRLGRIALSPDSRLVAGGTARGSVLVWQADGRLLHHLLQGDEGLKRGQMAIVDSEVLQAAMAGLEPDPEECFDDDGLYPAPICAVVFSPDGRFVASDAGRGEVRIWEAGSGRLHAVLEDHQGAVESLVFSPDAAVLAVATSERTVRLWQVETGTGVATMCGYREPAFSPDGSVLIAARARHPSLPGLSAYLWESAASIFDGPGNDHLQDLFVVPAPPPVVPSEPETADAPTPDAALSDGDGQAEHEEPHVKLWCARTGRPLASLSAATGHATQAFYSPDGSSLTVRSEDGITVGRVPPFGPLGRATPDDLAKLQARARDIPGSPYAPMWRFTAALLEHRLRYDVEIGEVAERLFSEFDIEIQE